MEKRLEEYRARRRNEQALSNVSSTSKQTVPVMTSAGSSTTVGQDRLVNDVPSDTESLISNASASVIEEPPKSLSQTDIAIYVVSAIFWLTVYAIAIHFEFGAVYFVVSLLFFIWKNTRTGPKKKNEISAYSVFNPNCEAIDGTLKAEQFEREIRYGPASVH
ncbi:hypothetical protein R5R35_011752 [Gryllus longicercus]|uniref:SAYSvFN domain-containing protein n=1 Tax=Gryllus longicercus TaxID=2509291 RepID=A0AAN9V2D3_9ORTH